MWQDTGRYGWHQNDNQPVLLNLHPVNRHTAGSSCTSGGLQLPAGVLIMLIQWHNEKPAGENTGASQLINLAQPGDCRPAVLCVGA